LAGWLGLDIVLVGLFGALLGGWLLDKTRRFGSVSR
jgi:hypothetical protein